jgi:hypothetical protein
MKYFRFSEGHLEGQNTGTLGTERTSNIDR